MITTTERLFDITPFNPNSFQILESTKLEPNSHLPGQYRWAHILFQECVEMVPFFHDKANPQLIPTAQTDDYDVSQELFRYWKETTRTSTEFSGYLVGAPVFKHLETGAEVQMLHLWSDNTDITFSSLAVPLHKVDYLRVCSEEVSDLHRELDEVSSGANSFYQVPILYKNGKPILAEATSDELRAAIIRLDDEMSDIVYCNNRNPRAPFVSKVNPIIVE